MGHFNPRRYPLGEKSALRSNSLLLLEGRTQRAGQLELLDGQGKVIRSYTSEEKKKQEAAKNGSATPPKNTFPPKPASTVSPGTCATKYPAKIPLVVYDAGDPIAPLVLPGAYQVRLTVAGKSQVAPLK